LRRSSNSHVHWTPHAPPFGEKHSDHPPHQDTRKRGLFKAAPPCTQGAFNRIDAQPRGWTERVRDTCSLPRPRSAPFRATHRCLPCSGRPAVPPYPAPPWFTLRLTSTTRGRCFSPISATDLRYEHPKIRSTPEPCSSRCRDRLRDVNQSVNPEAIRKRRQTTLRQSNPR